MIVDLGCGGNKRGDIGIDAVAGPGVDYVVQLGVETLPFGSDTVDRFEAHDFLEHLPVSIWLPKPQLIADGESGWIIRRPRIFLLREIYRCLKPGGTFFSKTPGKLPEWAQDPTHEAPPWVPETWDYFCGGYGDLPKQYGIDFAFELIERQWDGAHLAVLVRKPQ